MLRKIKYILKLLRAKCWFIAYEDKRGDLWIVNNDVSTQQAAALIDHLKTEIKEVKDQEQAVRVTQRIINGDA